MKRIAILLFAVLALCVLASCDQNPSKGNIENTKLEVYNYSEDLSYLNAICEVPKQSKRKILLKEGTVELEEYTWIPGEEKWSDKVVYKGTYESDSYDLLVEDTPTRIEKTRTQTITFSFNEVSDKTYRDNLRLYSGSVDVEYVSGYGVVTNSWKAKNGGWERYYNSSSNAVTRFNVTQNPKYDTDQSLLQMDWKKNT